MKKILALLLVLVMCAGVFVGCKKNKEAGVTLEQAKDYLYATYKDKNDKATPNDYDVLGKIIIEETTFDVTWTTDNASIVVKASSKADFWTIDVPSVNAAEVKYTLTATIKNEAGETIQVSFTPVLPVIDNTGVETDFQEGVAYTMFMKQMNLGYTVYALNTTQNGENKYIETTLDPKAAAAFYVEIVDGGYKIYTEIAGVKNYLHAELKDAGEGKVSKYIGFKADSTCVFTYEKELGVFKINLNGTWYGVGTYQAYETICISEASFFTAEKINIVDKNGQFPIGLMTKAYADTLAPSQKPANNDPAANSTLTIAEAIALGLTKNNSVYTEGKYYVQGQVKEIQSDVYGNLVLTDGTNDILVYGTWSEDGNTRFDKLANKPAVGDTIKVYGIIGKYNDAAQMKNGWITGATASGSTTPTPTPPAGNYEVVEAPVAGTAYKFGMVQTAAGKTVYLKGGMDGFYMATTENAAEAIDVYLEATTGGYYFYTMNGTTKTYLNVVVEMGTDNKEHVNAVYGTTASTVYTLDATLKTLVVTITGTAEGAKDGAYAFGTRSDKTYTTVGAVQADTAKSFICQFYALADGGNNGGSTGGDNNDPGTPPAGGDNGGDNGGSSNTPSAITSITEAMSAAVGTPVVLTGVVISADAWNTQHNNMSVTIRDAGGAEIYVFGLATLVARGDTITVTGEVGVYNDINQVAKGATATIDVVHGNNHTYENGTCTACGALQPVAGQTTATISFADTANRTVFTTAQQVWVQNGVTVTNDKASSTSNVADYSNPARFYKSSSLTVAYTGMTKIIFECNSSSYASALQTSITAASGVTVTLNGANVEVSFSAATDSFNIATLSAQVRVNSITVVAAN